MYSQWYRSGIKYFEDIYDNAAKSLYTFRRLKEKYTLPEGDFLNIEITVTPEIISEQKWIEQFRRRRSKLQQNIYQLLTGN